MMRKVIHFSIAILMGLGTGTVLYHYGFREGGERKEVEKHAVAHPTLLPAQDSDDSHELTEVQRLLSFAEQVEQADLAKLKELMQRAESEENHALQSAVAHKWAVLDPHSLHEWIQSENKLLLITVLFEEWTQSDPQGAVDKGLASNLGVNEILQLWRALMRNAPEVGIKVAADVGKHADQIGAYPNLDGLEEWAATDPRASAELVAEHMSEMNTGRKAMERIGTLWGSRDPQGAMKFADQLKGALRDSLMKSVMRSWALSDADAALAHINAHDDAHLRALMRRGLASGLAENDTETALAWIEDNLESSARSAAVGEVVKLLAEKDINSVASRVALMEPGGTMGTAVSEVMKVWIRTDISENPRILDWIETLPDGEFREKAMALLSDRIQYGEEEGLIGFLESPHGHLATTKMIVAAARQRTNRDSASAEAWARGLSGPHAEEALRVVRETLDAARE